MKLDGKTIKTYSRVGQRAAFGLAAMELAKRCEDLMILTADVSTSAGLDRFRRTLPDKFLDVGIAEQNMMSVAAGLASEGFRVVTATFAPFQSMRCCEQIRVNLGYMREKVCMVGLASGVALGTLGSTHCCFEDIGVLRSIPNLAIVSPCDCGEVAKALFAAVEHDTSVYLRLTGAAPCPIVNMEDYEFAIGKATTLRWGNTVALAANGATVHKALAAADLLKGKGIDPTVINMHTVKPLDTETLDRVSHTHELIVTVEEHSVIGGLGSAVAEHLARTGYGGRQVFLGVDDRYESVAGYEELCRRYGLTAEQITDSVLHSIAVKGKVDGQS